MTQFMTRNTVYTLRQTDTTWQIKGHATICPDWTECHFAHAPELGARFKALMPNGMMTTTPVEAISEHLF